MHVIDDWLIYHPEARVDKTELFNRPADEVDDLPLTEPACVVQYLEALSRRAAEHGAPDEVQNEFAELLKTVRRNAPLLDDPDGFLRKTLASLSGIRDGRDVSLVLKGALPHAPSDKDRDLVTKMSASIKGAEPEGITSGGSWIWCGIGCLLCEVACLACCTLML